MSTGKNVFIVGPGLIGWTVLDLLVAEGYKVTGLVRRQSHADGLKQSGADAVIGDLHDAKLIAEQVSKNDIVLHTATADDLPSVQAVLQGVQQKADRNEPIIYIHTSGTSVLDDNAQGNHKSDKIYHDNVQSEIDSLSDNAPHRQIDLTILKTRKELGSKAQIAIMIPPLIYGTSHGRLTIQLPTLARWALKHGHPAHVGAGKSVWSNIHVADLARGFVTVLHHLESKPSDANPYFFATTPNGVDFQGKLITVGAFPIGIDPEKFDEGLKKPKVQERIAALEKKFEGVKLIVGVDRLDYIKGVPQKLHALEVFLTEHPEWIGKVVLVQVAVPSRQDVEEYQNLRAVVNELVGRINGKFGTIEFMPIHFMHKSVSFDELIALYSVSDACLVSSTRDGMNLVSYEYIATQEKRHGVMILSEFTGAAQSLNGSLIVNPWNTEELADSIHDAVTMGDEQRAQNYEKLSRYIRKYTSAWWGQSFVQELKRISEQADRKVKFAPRAEGQASFQPKLTNTEGDGTNINAEATSQQAAAPNGAPVPQQQKDDDTVVNPS